MTVIACMGCWCSLITFVKAGLVQHTTSFPFLLLQIFCLPYTYLWRLMVFTLSTAPQFHCVVSLLTGQLGAGLLTQPPQSNISGPMIVFMAAGKDSIRGQCKSPGSPSYPVCHPSVTLWPAMTQLCSQAMSQCAPQWGQGWHDIKWSRQQHPN